MPPPPQPPIPDPRTSGRHGETERPVTGGLPFMLVSVLLCGPAIVSLGLVCFTFGLVMLSDWPEGPGRLVRHLGFIILLGLMPLLGLYGLCRTILSRGRVVPAFLLACGLVVAIPMGVLALIGLFTEQPMVEAQGFDNNMGLLTLSLWACIAMALVHLLRRFRGRR
jgi:hypothetical protein